MVVSDVLSGVVIGFVITVLVGIVVGLIKDRFIDWLDYRIRQKTGKDFLNLYDMCHDLQNDVQKLKIAQQDLDERIDLVEEELDGKDGAW